jgi:hypothetical protein
MAASAASVMPGRARTRARWTAEGGGDDEDGVESGLRAGLEKERDVQDDQWSVPVRGEKGRAVGGDEGMDARLDLRQQAGIAEDCGAEAVAVHAALHDGLGSEGREGVRAGAAGGVEAAHGGVGVPDGDADLGEEGGGG